MRKGIAGVVVVIVAGGLSAVLYSRSASSGEPAFKTVAVTRGPVVEKALAVGSIGPKQEIAVKSKIPGIVKTSYREVGDEIRSGDPLFDIVPDPTPLELTEARRALEIARNAHDQARKAYDRMKTLQDQGIVSSEDWEQAEKNVLEAEIRLNLASEKLALTEKGRVQSKQLIVESVIRAPIDGMVLELLVHEGDPVVPLTSFQAGTALTSLADMSRLVFKGTVDEIDVGKLHEGMPARIKVGALPDANVEGRVYKIAPKSKSEEGATLFGIEIELLPTEGVLLRAGYSANADIVVKEKQNTLLIPERLVAFDDGEASVEIPGGPDEEPTKQIIEVGLSDGINIEVLEGLKEGDLVVERPPKQIV
jgi:HlyD family secretion protein